MSTKVVKSFESFCITGVGMVSPFGSGFNIFKDKITEQASGVRPLSLFSEQSYRQTLAAEIGNFEPAMVLGKKGLRGLNRITLILMETLQHNINDNSLQSDGAWVEHLSGERVAINIGTHGSIKSDHVLDIQAQENPAYITMNEFALSLACVPIGYAAIRFGIEGSAITFANGETSSLDAIGYAGNQLDSGKVDMVIAGGSEELTLEYALLMQGIAEYNSISSPILGEGGVVFNCERKESAEKRGASAMAEVLGYSSGFHPDSDIAFKNNINGLTEQLGYDIASKVDSVFHSDRNIKSEQSMFSQSKLYSVQSQLGYMHSAVGAFKIATSIASAEVAEGELVLINDVSHDGAAASMLLRKLRSEL